MGEGDTYERRQIRPDRHRLRAIRAARRGGRPPALGGRDLAVLPPDEPRPAAGQPAGRGGDDVGAAIMRGGRVEARTLDGLYLVRVDSTGPHNRFLLAGHGDVSEEVIEQVALGASGSRFGGEFWNNLPNESVPSQGIPLTEMNLFFLQVRDDEGQIVLYGATDRKPTYALQNLFRQNISVNWPFTYFLDQAV